MIIGIVGCGVIGSEICYALSADGFQGELLLMDRHYDRAQHLADGSAAATAVVSLQQIIDSSISSWNVLPSRQRVILRSAC